MKYPVYTKEDLLEILPFGKTKLNELLQNGSLPAVKVGRQYLINQKELDDWFHNYRGKEIKY